MELFCTEQEVAWPRSMTAVEELLMSTANCAVALRLWELVLNCGTRMGTYVMVSSTQVSDIRDKIRTHAATKALCDTAEVGPEAVVKSYLTMLSRQGWVVAEASKQGEWYPIDKAVQVCVKTGLFDPTLFNNKGPVVCVVFENPAGEPDGKNLQWKRPYRKAGNDTVRVCDYCVMGGILPHPHGFGTNFEVEGFQKCSDSSPCKYRLPNGSHRYVSGGDRPPPVQLMGCKLKEYMNKVPERVVHSLWNGARRHGAQLRGKDEADVRVFCLALCDGGRSMKVGRREGDVYWNVEVLAEMEPDIEGDAGEVEVVGMMRAMQQKEKVQPDVWLVISTSPCHTFSSLCWCNHAHRVNGPAMKAKGGYMGEEARRCDRLAKRMTDEQMKAVAWGWEHGRVMHLRLGDVKEKVFGGWEIRMVRREAEEQERRSGEELADTHGGAGGAGE
jgi:hypothetical protein